MDNGKAVKSFMDEKCFDHEVNNELLRNINY